MKVEQASKRACVLPLFAPHFEQAWLRPPCGERCGLLIRPRARIETDGAASLMRLQCEDAQGFESDA